MREIKLIKIFPCIEIRGFHRFYGVTRALGFRVNYSIGMIDNFNNLMVKLLKQLEED